MPYLHILISIRSFHGIIFVKCDIKNYDIVHKKTAVFDRYVCIL